MESKPVTEMLTGLLTPPRAPEVTSVTAGIWSSQKETRILQCNACEMSSNLSFPLPLSGHSVGLIDIQIIYTISSRSASQENVEVRGGGVAT